MTDVERQLLFNQYAMMAFLHGVSLDKVSGFNSGTFQCLQQCIKDTGEMIMEGMDNG